MAFQLLGLLKAAKAASAAGAGARAKGESASGMPGTQAEGFGLFPAAAFQSQQPGFQAFGGSPLVSNILTMSQLRDQMGLDLLKKLQGSGFGAFLGGL